MNNSKKIFAGLLAVSVTMGLTACGDKSNGDSGSGDAGETTTSATTTTGVTVEINTEGLKEGEDEVLENAMSQLKDVELENKEIKWLAHYDINPSTTGESKKVELEMFERKYGGSIKYYPTTYENRYNDLSTNVLGGEGIDLFPGQDVNNLPKGIVSGMFQPVDDYIDLNDAIWQNTAAAMELMNFGGKHYQFVTNVTAEQVVLYNKATIEANGLDDPWDLYEAGEWNWDTFKSMLLDFVDEDAGQYGLDGWYNEKALFLSAGVPFVSTDENGNLVCNVNDATVEKAMNYQLDLYNSGLVLPLEQFNWAIQPQMMGEGSELFMLWGMWGVQGDPATWNTKIEPENLGIAPVPSPAGSDPYQAATLDGFVLCKGANNPEGAARFVECVLVANSDEGAIAISDRKAMDDNGWSEEILEKSKAINELARQYPVYDLAAGCSTDIASLTTDGGAEIGLRAAFHGYDWATNREAIGDTLIMLVDEVNTQIQEKVAAE
ncbi:MAG: extracellular solute-binding protein [Oscillospiraceae bacterium]|nr:extracellular solute-binding protein [Oscillospiraceae bacterium]